MVSMHASLKLQGLQKTRDDAVRALDVAKDEVTKQLRKAEFLKDTPGIEALLAESVAAARSAETAAGQALARALRAYEDAISVLS